MDVLLRIKGVINPTAEKVIGSPMLVFERSRVDDETGEMVLFSWWLITQMVIKETDKKATRVDIFDEEDRIDLVADLSGLGIREEDITLRIVGDRVVLSAKAGDEKYYEEIALPSEVNTDEFMRACHNNILALSLQKLHYSGSADKRQKGEKIY